MAKLWHFKAKSGKHGGYGSGVPSNDKKLTELSLLHQGGVCVSQLLLPVSGVSGARTHSALPLAGAAPCSVIAPAPTRRLHQGAPHVWGRAQKTWPATRKDAPVSPTLTHDVSPCRTPSAWLGSLVT